jgi:hypothetical protein
MTADDDALRFTPDALAALAIEEQFMREWRAGAHPRLSVYALRYPAHAATLAALVAGLPSDAGASPERVETLLESFPERLWNGAGVTRALASAFGDLPAQPAQPDDAPLQRVAEERTSYDATRTDDPTDDPAAPESSPERPGDD